MRLVTVDNGNTNPNVAVHENGAIRATFLLADYHPLSDDFVLVSSVGQALPFRPSFDLKKKRTSTAFFDMPVDYAQTLGDDRMIAGYWMYKNIAPHEKVLLIDAGTFMTCDLISSQGFMGGYIFPGVERFLKTYADSAQLPHLDRRDFQTILKNPVMLPHHTQEAIVAAVRMYFESVLAEIIKQHSPDKIVIAGGSAEDIALLINSKVRFELVHHLIHSALSLIFDLHLRSSP